MLSITCPPAVRKVADRYKDLVPFGYGALCTLLMLHLLGCRSLCEAARTIGWSPSVSTLDRAVQQFTANRFMRRMRASVLNRFAPAIAADPERFCFVVDDTLVERFGPKIHAIGHHVHHGKNGVTRGQRVLVLALVDIQRGVALPLAFALCRNKKDEGYKPLHDLCFELVEEVVAAGFPPLVTVADSGFDSMPLMKRFHEKGWSFAVEVRSNRKAKLNPSPRARWLPLRDALHKETKVSVKLGKTSHRKKARKTKYVASRFVQLNGRSAPASACAVYNRPSDAQPFAFYVSNNLSICGERLWQLSRARWHIEEMFRALKQTFSFLAVPTQGEGGTMAAICLPMLLLVEIHAEPSAWGGSEHDAVGTIVGRIRSKLLWDTVDELSAGSKRPSICTLRARRPNKDHRQKPVNPTADELRRFKMSA